MNEKHKNKEFEYSFPKVGDQLYLDSKRKSKNKSGFYRLVCCCDSYYSLVSEDTWKTDYRFNDIADLMDYYLKENRVFKVEK